MPGRLAHHLRELRRWVSRIEAQRRLAEQFPTATLDGVRVIGPDRLRLGRDVIVQPGTLLHCGGLAWSGGRGGIEIGDGSTISPGCQLWGAGEISIGRNFACGPGVMILSSQQRYAPDPEDPTASHWFARVTIGDDALIYAGSIVGPGVTVGDGAVIAGNSLVLRDVPARTMWAGSPARLVRELDSWRPPSRG